MPGVRIVHQNPNLRNVTVTITHPYLPYPTPQLCPTCNILHHTKTYHLNLDDQASTIVSHTVLERLKQIGNGSVPGFDIEAEIQNPPPVTIDLQNGQAPRIITQRPSMVASSQVSTYDKFTGVYHG